jgi:hypothetical protein
MYVVLVKQMILLACQLSQNESPWDDLDRVHPKGLALNESGRFRSRI